MVKCIETKITTITKYSQQSVILYRQWCDFVVHTEKDIFVERVNCDKKWWEEQLIQLQTLF